MESRSSEPCSDRVVTTLNVLKHREVVQTPRRADVSLAAEGRT